MIHKHKQNIQGHGQWLILQNFFSHSQCFFKFQLQKIISSEPMPLYVLLWLLWWHITNNSSHQGNLLSCSKFWAKCKGTYWTIFFLFTICCQGFLAYTTYNFHLNSKTKQKHMAFCCIKKKSIIGFSGRNHSSSLATCLSGWTSWELWKVKSGKFPVTKTKKILDT